MKQPTDPEPIHAFNGRNEEHGMARCGFAPDLRFVVLVQVRYNRNMILTRDIILKEINAGNIAISPFDESLLGAASYDLALGSAIRVFTGQKEAYPVRDDADFAHITELIAMTEEGYTMQPGQALLGVTNEKITLAPHIAGWLEGRSRFARVGLMVHISSPFMQPGIDSHQVLEIANLAPTPLTIFPGTKICQFVFEYCEGNATYQGKFAGQTLP